MGWLGQKLKDSRTDSDSAMTDLLAHADIDTLIGIPSWQGGLEPDTQQCLDHLCQYNLLNGNKVSLSKSTGSLIAENRNKVIEVALEVGARYVLFIDTDMVFPKEAIQRMQLHRKPIVSATAFVKSPPYMPNMYKRVSVNGWVPIREWERGKLLQVDCIGGAFMLVEASVFKRMPGPWFAQPAMIQHILWEELRLLFAHNPNDEQILKAARNLYEQHGDSNKNTLGEDYYFSELCRRSDVPIYVDTDMMIGHIGKYLFGYRDFVEQEKSGALVKYKDFDKMMEQANADSK